MKKRLRFDQLSQLPTILLAALAYILIEAGHWVRRIDDSISDLGD